MSRIIIFLYNLSNELIEEKNLDKPKNYEEFCVKLKQCFKKLPEYYEVFITDKNNKKIILNEEEYFNIIKNADVLFVREVENMNFDESIFESNYKKLSESEQEKLDEKYNCILCFITIKNEQPYFCYKCQKIFHQKCLKNWDEKSKSLNKKLSCPHCMYELPFEKWNKQLDYEDNRINNAYLLSEINEYKLTNSINSSINLVKDKMMEKIKNNYLKQNDIIKKYTKYIIKTFKIFKYILNKINSIHSFLKLKINHKLNDITKNLPLNFKSLDIDDISNVIFEELDILENFIKNKHYNSNILKVNKENSQNKTKEISIINSSNIFTSIDAKEEYYLEKEKITNKNEINGEKKSEYKNKINLKYLTEDRNYYYIFGEKFVKNNEMNIDLIINGEQSNLTNEYILEKGYNNITLIIKNKLIDLSNMFCCCSSLKNIEELKYLDVTKVIDLSYMFFGCSMLSDIKALENWDVSCCNDFSNLFKNCTNLSDIKALENWNVSNGIDFSNMFSNCPLLSNINALKNWNVSNGIDFSGIFSKCTKLSDISPLENWKVSNGKYFSSMFSYCYSLSDIKSLDNWDVSKAKDFTSMFLKCNFKLNEEYINKFKI